MDYYQPAGFANPPLRSGHFLTSVFYSHQLATQTVAEMKTDRPEKEIILAGYLGLTDFLTLQTNIAIIPDQTILELRDPQVGKDKLKFNIRPQVMLSYRPLSNLEIFGDFYFINQTTDYGEKGTMRDVPVEIDPITGIPIYEPRLVFQPAGPSIEFESTMIRFGFTYLGTLW